MVTCETILEKAKEYNVDVIGLSSLITLSLDEMVDVTKQMSKGGFKRTLMIGGATTSKIHTAVKITPNYFTMDHPVIHVLMFFDLSQLYLHCLEVTRKNM